MALGIPTAILAHTVLFGDGHQLGGSLHASFVGAAIAVAIGFVVLFSSLALAGAAEAATTGSLLATRLDAWLPRVRSLALCALGWYAAIECSESDGHAPAHFFALAIALIASSLAVRYLARAFVGAIATVTLAARVRRFAGRAFAFAPRTHDAPLAATGCIVSYRRFARPPPYAMQRA